MLHRSKHRICGKGALLGVSRPWTIFRQLIRKFSFGYTYEECLHHGMRGRCHHCFMLQILCLFLWRHLENISALLLRMCFLSAFIILNFSLRQRLRRFAPLLYGLARFKMDHFPKHWRASFLVPRCSLIAQCPFHVPDHERISCGYCSVA